MIPENDLPGQSHECFCLGRWEIASLRPTHGMSALARDDGKALQVAMCLAPFQKGALKWRLRRIQYNELDFRHARNKGMARF